MRARVGDVRLWTGKDCHVWNILELAVSHSFELWIRKHPKFSLVFLPRRRAFSLALGFLHLLYEDGDY